jgi:hypothetical protein
MKDVYVIRNQLGHYWGKSKAWVDGSEPRAVMRSPHRDEATNTLVELSAKDIDLRGEIVAVALSDKGDPQVEASEIPVPLTPEQIAAEEAARLAREQAETSAAEPASSPEENLESADSDDSPSTDVATGSA